MPIIKTYYKVYRIEPDPEFFYVKNEENSSNTITINKLGTVATTDLEYSKDLTTWTSIDLTQSSTTVSLSTGEYLYMKSSTGLSNFVPNSNRITITGTGNFSAGGDLRTLLNYTDVKSVTSLPNGCFGGLFLNATKLISVENLKLPNVTVIGQRSMEYMFRGCTSLTDGFIFSSVISSYSGSALTPSFGNMYYGCSKLQSAYIPQMSTQYIETGFNTWLSGAGTSVSGSKIVYAPTGLTIPTDSTSGIPTGWARVDY